jgi:hypothetical protein
VRSGLVPRLLPLLSFALALGASLSLAPARLSADDAKALTIDSPEDAQACSRLSERHRPEIAYHPDRSVRSVTCARDGVKDGPHTAWYPTGSKERQGTYRDGRMEGVWTRWRADQSPIDIGPWKDGAPHGYWRIYSESGALAEEGYFEKGKAVCGWKTHEGATSLAQQAAPSESCAKLALEKPSAQAVGSAAAARPARRSWSLVPGVGMSVNSTREKDTSFRMVGLTGKFAGQLRLTDSIDLSMNAYSTLLTLSSNLNAMKVRYVGANLRAAYLLPWPSRPWSLSLALGLSYGKMIVSGARFGYGDILFPQLYPSVRRELARGALAAYLKYVPLGTKPLSLDLAHREIGVGLSYERPFRARWTAIYALDVSDLSFLPGNSSYEIRSRSSTFGLGVAF